MLLMAQENVISDLEERQGGVVTIETHVNARHAARAVATMIQTRPARTVHEKTRGDRRGPPSGFGGCCALVRQGGQRDVPLLPGHALIPGVARPAICW